jgi:hypothetical protein
MGLRVWNLLLDPYDHEQFANNWAKVDAHDHSPGRGVLIPTEGIANEAISFGLLAGSIFPEVSGIAGEQKFTAAEGKSLSGGPTLKVPATGVYQIGLTLSGAVEENVLVKLKAYVSKNTAKTAFPLFEYASATKEATITTTNFTRAELKAEDTLTVWCVSGTTGHCAFGNARISIWKVA